MYLTMMMRVNGDGHDGDEHDGVKLVGRNPRVTQSVHYMTTYD